MLEGWNLTQIFHTNLSNYLNPQYRRSLNEGGTASSKTYSILQLLVRIAQTAKTNTTISVVSESMPHLKKGCIKDFKDIMGDAFNDDCYNKTEQQYHFGRNVIEFFGADESAKVRGPRREILYINEANNVPWETARNLDVRTSRFIFADWNPVSEFWAYDNWKGKPENAWVHSTYLDAKWVLPAETVKTIESYRESDPNWWNIYGLGRIGKVSGLVYPYFEQCDSLPDKGEEFYGLDFGYTDPKALIRCGRIGKDLYLDEVLYERQLTREDFIKLLPSLIDNRGTEIWADSEDPESIQVIFNAGWNIHAVEKLKGSVLFGVEALQAFNIHITERSTNIIKDFENYKWKQRRDGQPMEKEEPAHSFSHSPRATEYAVRSRWAELNQEITSETMRNVEIEELEIISVAEGY